MLSERSVFERAFEVLLAHFTHLLNVVGIGLETVLIDGYRRIIRYSLPNKTSLCLDNGKYCED